MEADQVILKVPSHSKSLGGWLRVWALGPSSAKFLEGHQGQ